MKRTLITIIALIIATGATPLFAADPYVPSDQERARWTMDDMNDLRTALAAYATDHREYPNAKTIEEVSAALEPKYIAHRPMHDAWGHPYRYEVDGKGGYRLVSAGADGVFQPDTWNENGRTKDLNADAVATKESEWLQRSWQTW
jgi:hypothetical protein